MRKKSILQKEIQIFNLLIIVLSVFLLFYSFVNQERINSLLQGNLLNYGYTSLFLIIFLLEFLPQAISPDYIIFISASLGFKLITIILIVSIASIIGSASAFILGYKKGFILVKKLIEEKTLKKILHYWNKYGKIFVLFSAIVPLPIPYFPLVFGALRMKFKEFIFWGIIPRVLGFFATGIVIYYGFDFLNNLF